jgi:hypothetical protein
MAKYHINPETGRPNQCTAKVKCRFGADTQHFDSKEAARAGYEKQMEGQAVSGSLKKTSETPAKKPLFDPKVVEVANKEIEKLSNFAVSIQLASDFLGDDSPELIIAFNAEHDMNIVIEEEDGKKVAYSGYGFDPRASRWPVSQFVTASRIDEMAMENEDYHPEAWRQEPSPQGEKIARLINAVVARPIDAPIAPKDATEPQVATEKAPAKTAPAVPAAPAPLAVIPGVPPVQTKQELDYEQGELQDELHGYTVKGLLQTRNVTLRDIEIEERKGSYTICEKVPSYYEVNISTDLARRELGLPPRPKTGIDEDPVRLAQIAKDDAYSKTFGVFHSREESMAANENYRKARNEYYNLREDQIDAAKKARDQTRQ